MDVGIFSYLWTDGRMIERSILLLLLYNIIIIFIIQFIIYETIN